MLSNIRFWRMLGVAVMLAMVVSVVGTSSAFAAKDRTAPTKPTNLRVTSKTAHNITLVWNPSTDNSGSFTYQVWVSYGFTHSVPQSQTTFSLGVVPANTYSFYVYAVDAAGNKSAKSNTVSATTPADTTAPTAPVLSVTGVNPTEVSLAWTASTDDGPHVFYQVFVNGNANVDAGQNRFAVVTGLSPQTTYNITVKARDLYGPNVSAPSNVVAVTTTAAGGVDTQPPTAPTGLYGWDAGDGAREINLFWTQSVDNQTPQASIMYEVYMNGVLDHTTGGGRAILYATQAGANVFTVIAVDQAGNKSQPASTTIVSQ